MKSKSDHLGRLVSAIDHPSKIVSLSPSQTELVCFLGLESLLVGVTDNCKHPYHLKSILPNLGSPNRVDLEIIESLNPDIILCNKEETGFNELSQLEAIAPTHFSSVNSIDNMLQLIRDYGELLNCRTASINLIQKINFKLSNFQKVVNEQPVRKVVYFLKADPWMAVGGSNYTNALLELNKFINIYAHMSQTPKIDIERIRYEGDPDVIFLSDESFKFEDSHALKLGNYSNRSVTVFANGELFSRFGPRLLKALDYFTELHKRLDSHF